MMRLVVTCSLMLLLACGESNTGLDPDPQPQNERRLTTIEIDPDSITLLQQGTYQLTVVLRDQDSLVMSGGPVTWTSTDPALVAIDGNGTVTANTDLGGASIIASLEAIADTAEVVVQVAWSSIATSFWWQHSCGVSVDGSAYCWGANESGQLGDGSMTDRLVPTAVQDVGASFVKIVVGSTHTCGLTDEWQVYCWGDNEFGQVGNDSNEDQPAPVLISGVLPFADIVAGGWHTCGLAVAGSLYCWGSNETSQLGLPGGSTGDQERQPVEVLDSYSFTSLDAGGSHTCGIQGGAAYCWGWNERGQLGDGTTNWGTHVPVMVQAQTTFGVLALTHLHSCGLDAASVVYCWGDYLGNQGTILPQVFTQMPFDSLSAGHIHLCGINNSHEAYCWGVNGSGQLGDGTTTTSTVPTLVQSSVPMLQIAAGSDHTCAIGVDYHAYCWGYNGRGQLGTGALDDSVVPTQIAEPE